MPSTAEATAIVARPRLRGWLHVAGVVALLACCPLLFGRATSGQIPWVLCYVIGVGSMMSVSSLYHRVHWSPPARRRMSRADLSAIYLAISGTYLAIVGLTMHGTIRVVFLSLVAIGATIGIIGSATGFIGRRLTQRLGHGPPKWVSTIPYLGVGWAAVAVMPQIYRGGGPGCFWMIVAGGVAYSLGALCYGLKRPRLAPRTFGYHELFHLGTLVGAGCHFAAIYLALK